MNISGKRELAGDIDVVWEMFMDPEALRNSLPGVSELNEDGGDKWNGKITMGVASIKGSYAVKVAMKDKLFPSHYTLDISGEGSLGWVNAEAAFNLCDVSGNSTLVSYDVEAQVGGLVASVGQRFLAGVAKLICKQFFDGMEKHLKMRLAARRKRA